MDDDVAVEPSRQLRRHERLELALRRPACQSRSDEKGLVARRDAEPLELRHDGGDGGLARVRGRGRNRQRRRLDDDRRARAPADERLQALALEREAKRVPHRRAHVRDALARCARPQHDGVLRCGGNNESSPRDERNPHLVSSRASKAYGPSAPDDSLGT